MAKIVLTIAAENKATESIRILNREVESLSKTLSSIKVNKDLTAQINALTKHYKAIVDANTKLAKSQSQQAIEEKKQLLLLEKVNTERNKQLLLETKTQKALGVTASAAKTLQKQYADLLTTINGLEKNYPKSTFSELKRDIEEGFNNIKSLNAEIGNNQPSKLQEESLQNLTLKLREYTTQLSTTKAETKSTHGSLLDIVSGFAKFQISAMLVMKPLQMIRAALSSINETLVKTEDSVIALQRVLPSDSASDNEISGKLYQIAQQYGQTFDNVSQIAQNFARTGMSWVETIQATEAAVLALNVAELDATQASDGMIAILTQFGLKAEDLTLVVDKLNITADNAAVTTEKLLAALQRTGSAADNANLSLDQTIALITALSKATGRSGENIGTALNSLIQYSSKASALDTFADLSEESAKVVENFRKGLKKEDGSTYTILDVWKQVSAEIKNIKSEQADLLDDYFATEDGNALKEALDGELEDIYTELGGVYDTANTFRKNYFIALLGNMDSVEKAMGTLQGASGYSQDENQKYLDTYTAKLNKLKAQWEDIANDEQGLLGIKKDLLDMGNGVLNVIQAVGGLKTALIAISVVVGTIVMQVKGAQIVAGLQLVGKTIKSLTVDAIPNLIAAWRAYRGETTLLNGQVVKLTGSTATFGLVAKAALPIVTAIIIAISALDKAIRSYYEEKAEEERKAIERQNEAIKKSNESIDTQKKEVAQMNEVADTVENLRNILDDSSQSEEEKAKAQEQLLQIQNTLIDSNNSYKDSLDLTNGSLKEQLGLIEQLTTEQLKQKARDFLNTNQAEIEIAKNRLDGTSTTNTDMLFSGFGWDRHDFREIINSAITGAGVGTNTHLTEDNTYGYSHNYGKRIGEGFKKGLWNGLFELTGLGALADKASYVGEANAGFSFSGTIEQQLESIEKLRNYIATNKDTLGLTAEQVVSITTELGNKYNELNSEEYKQAQLLAEKAKATQDWLNGTIDEAEYLKIVYGIEKEISEESDKWTNNIQDVKGKYDDLISKLEELRDLQKESTEWEEKKLAVLEAEQALENARNEATVRRFNQATGQWEWQTDEKKIAEAEKNLEEARLHLQETAYNTIIDQLKKEEATNESILAILKEVAPLLGEDFVEAVKNAVKDKTQVDLDKPTIDPNAQRHPQMEKWTSYKDAAKDGFANIRTESEFARGNNSDKEKYKTYQAYLDAMHEKFSGTYDHGGIANGLGFMRKETSQPESVNDPILTKKILTPTSSREFDQYVKNMGIIFERAHQYQSNPVVERIGNSTDNRVDNSNQVFIDGVHVAEAKRENIIELLNLDSIISD